MAHHPTKQKTLVEALNTALLSDVTLDITNSSGSDSNSDQIDVDSEDVGSSSSNGTSDSESEPEAPLAAPPKKKAVIKCKRKQKGVCAI
jgi:hypothetical protein